MKTRNITRRARLGTALAALALGVGSLCATAPAAAAQPSGSYKPTKQLLLSTGEGQMVNLPRTVTSVWTSNPEVADVYVSSPRQISVFGKVFGEATVIATGSDGSVVYGAKVSVSPNISSINDALRLAMPESNITVTPIGQMAIINGTVASPEDASQAEMLVRSVLNAGIKEGEPLKILPVNRLKTATPLQVTLKVRIAEVNRSLLKKIGVNLLSSDSSSGILFGIGQGDPSASSGPGSSPFFVNPLVDGGTTLGLAGKLLGVNLAGSLDLAEKDGLVTVLAEPNLTALSGETASFLAGGEFPIPVSQGGTGSGTAITIEYKQYGVGLAFTPIVLADGRISMRVRPEVSELSNEGAVKLNNFLVPAVTTRRAETTVELGSGQSFMIAGLLRNSTTNDVTKAPFLGDLPILGALFKSTGFRRSETELVIIVTPYLVRPVSRPMYAATDGYRAPDDAQRVFMNQTYTGVSGYRPPAAVPAGSAPVPAVSAPSGAAAGSAAVAAPGFKL